MPFYKQSLNEILKIEKGTLYFIVKNKTTQYIASIDEEDKEVLEYTWSCKLNKHKKPCAVRSNKNRKQQKLHRVLLKVTNPNIIIDHIDNNPLNNCKDNLRICSKKANSRNQKLNITSTTKFKGVSQIKATKKYRAYICIDYKQKHLGVFNSPEEAADAYNKAAIEYFGEYARLNLVK